MRQALSSEFVDALVASGVSACAMRVALVVARLQGRNADAWPTMETLRARVGCDLRSVQRAVAELKSRGLLSVTEQRGKGHRFAVQTPGVSVAPGSVVTPGDNAIPTPGVDATPPPAFLSPTPGISVVSSAGYLLLEKSDQGNQIIEVPAREVGRTDLIDLPLGRLLKGFQRRWESKRLPNGQALGAGWPGFGKHRGRADELAASYADKPDALERALDAYFAADDDPFVASVGWNFATFANDPERWLRPRRARVTRREPAAHDADESTPITENLFLRREPAA